MVPLHCSGISGLFSFQKIHAEQQHKKLGNVFFQVLYLAYLFLVTCSGTQSQKLYPDQNVCTRRRFRMNKTMDNEVWERVSESQTCDHLQHYLTMFGATIAIPLIVAPAMCVGDDNVAKSEILGTLLFVSGIITLLQSTLGVRWVYFLYICSHIKKTNWKRGPINEFNFLCFRDLLCFSVNMRFYPATAVIFFLCFWLSFFCLECDLQITYCPRRNVFLSCTNLCNSCAAPMEMSQPTRWAILECRSLVFCVWEPKFQLRMLLMLSIFIIFRSS